MLVDEAARHGITLNEGSGLERRANLEFIERPNPGRRGDGALTGCVFEDWVLYAEVQGKVEVQASESWEPAWFPLDAIPYHNMPVDDAVWYPPFLEGNKMCGRFVFQGQVLVGSSLEIVEGEAADKILYPDRGFGGSQTFQALSNHLQSIDKSKHSLLDRYWDEFKHAPDGPTKHEIVEMLRQHVTDSWSLTNDWPFAPTPGWREYSSQWRQWRIREGKLGTTEGLPCNIEEHSRLKSKLDEYFKREYPQAP